MSVIALPATTGTYLAADTSEMFVPTTDWVLVTGIAKVVFALIRRNGTNHFRVRPGVQYAAVHVNDPGTPVAIGSQVTSGSSAVNRFEVTPSAASQFYMRLGVLVSSASGNAWGEVTLLPTLHQDGRLAGDRAIAIATGMMVNSNSTQIPCTPWLPVARIGKAKLAVLVGSNLAATWEFRVACRTAIDPAEPSAFTAMAVGGRPMSWITPSGGSPTFSHHNTGELDFPAAAAVSDQVFVQLAIALQTKGADDRPSAVLRALTAITYP